MVLKQLIFTVSTLGRHAGLERTDLFNSFSILEGVVVLKITDFNTFYLGRVHCLERTKFEQFLWW